MKIEDKAPPIGFPANASPPAGQADKTAFRDQLRTAFNANKVERNPAPPVAATRPLAILTPLTDVTALRTDSAVQHFEGFLDALTAYQERLGNSGIDLKALEQDLNRIDTQCRRLDTLSKDAQIDDDLRALLQEGIAAARVEKERFYRGDYC